MGSVYFLDPKGIASNKGWKEGRFQFAEGSKGLKLVENK